MALFTRDAFRHVRFKTILAAICVVLVFYLVHFGISGRLQHAGEIFKDGGGKFAYWWLAGVPPVNQYTYPFVIRSEHKCKSEDGKRRDDNITLIIVIKSSVHRFERRKAIRQTWGWERRFPDVPIRRVFNLGSTKNQTLMRKVKYEQHVYGDIVQSSVTENHVLNRTLKTVMGIRWVVENCKKSQFVLFVNDDYYVSVKNVLQFISYPYVYPNLSTESVSKLQKESHFRGQNSHLWVGFAIYDALTQRNLSNDLYVSPSIYPLDAYPPYITSGVMVTSLPTLRALYYASMYTDYVSSDDVYLSIVARRAGIHFVGNQYFYTSTKRVATDFRFVIVAPGYGETSELTSLWWKQFKLGQA